MPRDLIQITKSITKLMFTTDLVEDLSHVQIAREKFDYEAALIEKHVQKKCPSYRWDPRVGIDMIGSLDMFGEKSRSLSVANTPIDNAIKGGGTNASSLATSSSSSSSSLLSQSKSGDGPAVANILQQQQQQQQQGRPCSPPAAFLSGKSQFQIDREEWLAARAAGKGDQITMVETRGGFDLSVDAADNTYEVYEVGAPVKCNYRSRGRYYTGIIEVVLPLQEGLAQYVVLYDDGERERVPHRLIHTRTHIRNNIAYTATTKTASSINDSNNDNNNNNNNSEDLDTSVGEVIKSIQQFTTGEISPRASKEFVQMQLTDWLERIEEENSRTFSLKDESAPPANLAYEGDMRDMRDSISLRASQDRSNFNVFHGFNNMRASSKTDISSLGSRSAEFNSHLDENGNGIGQGQEQEQEQELAMLQEEEQFVEQCLRERIALLRAREA